MNYVNYIRHTLYSPDTYHRRFDLDFLAAGEFRRIALASLPFIAMYRPVGFSLSLGMNAARTFTHLQGTLKAETHGKWAECAVETAKASLSILTLTAALFHLPSSLFITSGFDAVQGALLTGDAFLKADYAKAFEEALQTLATVAYLGFMATGALEMMLTFSLLQAALSLYQARKEIVDGHYIEAAAKLGLAAMRISSAKTYLRLIEKRNAFMKIEQIRSIFFKIYKGKEAYHLTRHPLISLQERIEANEVILQDKDGADLRFGSHFHGNGGTLVKGENLAFRTKIIDGEEMIELDFKVNHAFRSKVDVALKQITSLQPKELKEILSLAGSHAEAITVGFASFLPKESPPGVAHEIHMKNLGTILIGANPDSPTLYDRVIVRIKSDQTLYELHEMLSILDLDQALCLSTNEEIERLKMGHLFRTFFPREAIAIERTEEFFQLPLEDLKRKMFEKAPEMENVFNTYFHKMTEEHLFCGRVRYRIEGLAEAAYNAGARGLTAAIMGAYTDKELFHRIASVLRLGMLATEVRHANDLGMHGLGVGVDYMSGGADSVFTQLITESHIKEKIPLDHFNYYSKVRLLFSLDALETGTYQYHEDRFGHRTTEDHKWFDWFRDEPYANRDNILEFIEKENRNPYSHEDQEVMIKERIAPSFLKALIVEDEKTKIDLIQYLEACGIMQNGKVFDRTADEFIRIGTQMTEDLIL
ncbi:MAG TPA: hypothetical protein VLE95_03445 [Chlamydiales bacterium]|nr:hypothetical protein [Chlamydiales bacterium]